MSAPQPPPAQAGEKATPTIGPTGTQPVMPPRVDVKIPLTVGPTGTQPIAAEPSKAQAGEKKSPAPVEPTEAKAPVDEKDQAKKLGPLPNPRTVTITFALDWLQSDISNGPLNAEAIAGIYTFIMMFGPPGVTPATARFKILIRLLVVDPAAPIVRQNTKRDVQIVGIHQRAVLYSRPEAGRPAYTRFYDGVVWSGTKIDPHDDIKPMSVMLRTYADEKEPNALVYHPPQNVFGHTTPGYFKMVHGKKFYLNITFDTGSTIAQLVGLEGWRPVARVIRPDQMDRPFTNFVTNWALGTELLAPDTLESAWLGRKTKSAKTPKELPIDRPDPVEMAARHKLLKLMGWSAAPDFELSPEQLKTAWDPSDEEFNIFAMSLNAKGTPSADMVLPLLDSRRYNPTVYRKVHSGWISVQPAQQICLSLGWTLKLFSAEEWPEGTILNAIEYRARLLARQNEADLTKVHRVMVSISLILTSLFEIWETLMCWKNIAAWMDKSERPIKGVRRAMINESIEEGEEVLKNLLHRVEWTLTCVRKSSKAMVPIQTVTVINVVMYALSADRVWLNSVSIFTAVTKRRLQDLIRNNSSLYEAYIAQHSLQDKPFRDGEMMQSSIPWPHSSKVKAQLEKTGWIWRPEPLRPDRMVCAVCGAEAAGWHPWSLPWNWHVVSKHPPGFIPRASVLIVSPLKVAPAVKPLTMPPEAELPILTLPLPSESETNEPAKPPLPGKIDKPIA